jgi:hypothetical protein
MFAHAATPPCKIDQFPVIKAFPSGRTKSAPPPSLPLCFYISKYMFQFSSTVSMKVTCIAFVSGRVLLVWIVLHSTKSCTPAARGLTGLPSRLLYVIKHERFTRRTTIAIKQLRWGQIYKWGNIIPLKKAAIKWSRIRIHRWVANQCFWETEGYDENWTKCTVSDNKLHKMSYWNADRVKKGFV